ncbi:long-chain fatty acid transport protein 2-like isoform X1 [Ostrea edulis]|uniref:long-chain fatty acid transport protein 2-like isoform X1 n=1 Tax=Ostrea edulis TaxID=37623 RepID=UPI0024AE9486|nr:long-chain fatty acid transport protein 2-like isoform X1 [Ostrea edulis]XP_048780353.2 long-chain fatty acid transport protein 2-like isoform X1 [Ostrea edulis]
MPLKRDKLLIGLGSVAGLSLAAWQTMCPWLKYDLQYLKIAMKVGKQIGKNIANQRYVIEMFEENVAKFPKQTMIIFEDKEYTFEFMNEQAKKVANIAYEWRFKVGEKVALLMQNHPAFIWTFLGLQKVGLSVAFLNHHNRGTSLLHTINVSRTRALIIGSVVELYNAIDEIRTELNIPLYICGYSSTSVPDGFISWDDLMLTSPAADICKSHRRDITLRTPCITIFTSGTTGLPKPVNFNHEKAITISGMLLATEGTSNDRLYTTTPLYHVLACIALFSVLESGATLVLKVQFSASQFFDDCRKHKVTVAQYVGELPRYLLHLPESPGDGNHNIRVMIGSGLRADIWEKFQKRFRIPKIVEAFSATEGTSNFFNPIGRIGSCGRLSPFLNRISPVKSFIVRYDPKTYSPLRNREGRCIPCNIGEPGLLIGGIPNKTVIDDGFYAGDKTASERKCVRNAFEEGDVFFNFGDLLYLDKDYFMYFKDRVGDTFRWKGENVSTNEVANVLTELPFIQDANVYGVEIPDADGRAGMAGILLKEGRKFKADMLSEIYQHCKKNLPNYAQPLFLRLIKEMPLTTTHKQKKGEYVKEGFNPSIIRDPLFRISPETKTYVPLTMDNIGTFLSKSRL